MRTAAWHISEQHGFLARSTAADGRLTPRALLVFAHPDDETLALGARLGRFVDAHLVQVTDGAPADGGDSRAHGFETLDEYRKARQLELAQALGVAEACGLTHECLGVADQEAALHLGELTRRLAGIIEAFRPEVVFTHAYEGGHPDHDACAFATAQAVAQIEPAGWPLIVEAPLYHLGASGGMETGTWAEAHTGLAEVAYRLTADEQTRKQRALACFRTQRETLAAFAVEWERFRVSPAHDFSRPPNAGAVLYDRFAWGVTSERFVELTRKAYLQFGQQVGAACR